MADKLTRLYHSGLNASSYFTHYIDYLHRQLQQMDSLALDSLVQAFLSAREAGKTIFFVGNGGSAATASHFAQDLATVGRKAGVEGFRAISLSDNTSYITALGNDIGYHQVFSEQMRQLFQPGDLLVAISASGNSPNILEAAKLAKERQGVLLALTGFDGGELARLADHTLLVKTPKGEYGPVEDGHMIIDHVVTGYLIEKLKQEKTQADYSQEV
ncbi:MAG: SIS domain-containing protein [Magnetococcales bacterium]|nr:SIS domain-containing protein [Magnetococcales bacterium]